MFRRFGSRVEVMERSEGFLAREDSDVADRVSECFREDGISVLLGASLRSVEEISGQSARLRLQTAAGEACVDGTDLLAVLGRAPNIEEPTLSAGCVKTDDRGYFKVNDRLETTAPRVWALGDMNNGPQFARVSLDGWRIVSANLTGGNRSTSDRFVPYAPFIVPDSGVGRAHRGRGPLPRPRRAGRETFRGHDLARRPLEQHELLQGGRRCRHGEIPGARSSRQEEARFTPVIQVAIQGGCHARLIATRSSRTRLGLRD